MTIDVRNNEELNRYELLVDDRIAGIADYHVSGDTLVFPHTEIDPDLRDRRLGEQLVRGALDDARRLQAKVRPSCSFVRHFIRDNPDYADLVPPSSRGQSGGVVVTPLR